MNLQFINNLTANELQALSNSDVKCMEYLAGIKWAQNFNCKKCGNNNFCDGKTPHSRKCTRCKNEESATANTLFHNVKFPINKAFVIAFSVINNSGPSVVLLSEQLGLNQISCWNFRKKVEDRINLMVRNYENTPLSVPEILAGKIESPFI
jgi:predicted Zn-ribbon and HTH transcriptional regulator